MCTTRCLMSSSGFSSMGLISLSSSCNLKVNDRHFLKQQSACYNFFLNKQVILGSLSMIEHTNRAKQQLIPSDWNEANVTPKVKRSKQRSDYRRESRQYCICSVFWKLFSILKIRCCQVGYNRAWKTLQTHGKALESRTEHTCVR